MLERLRGGPEVDAMLIDLFDGADERPHPLLWKPFEKAELADHLRRGLHHEASLEHTNPDLKRWAFGVDP